MAPPRVLILGHFFIRRLKDFIASHPDLNANFLIAEACEFKWHGVGGKTIAKARAFDLPMVESFLPQIVILQLGSNDLVHADPLSIASAIEDLVTLLHDRFLLRLPNCLSRIEPYRDFTIAKFAFMSLYRDKLNLAKMPLYIYYRSERLFS